MVKNKLTIEKETKINFKDNIINSTDSAVLVNKLTLIYSGTTKVNFEDLRIYGNIFIEKVELTVQDSSSINGVLLYKGDKATFINGGGISNLLLIAPFAKVSVTSLKIMGTVIANEFDLMGGASLTYNPNIDTSGFPRLSSGPVTTPKLEDLIKQSGPILEQ